MKKSLLKNLAAWSGAIAVVFFSGYLLLTQIAPSLFGGLFERSSETRMRAPLFVLRDVSGENKALADFLGENVVLLFWTTWNEASFNQLKILSGLPSNLLHSKNVALVAINSLEAEPQVRAAVESLNNAEIVYLLDTDGAASEAHNAGVLPLLVFIDKNGFIVKEVAGPISQKELEGVIKDFR